MMNPDDYHTLAEGIRYRLSDSDQILLFWIETTQQAAIDAWYGFLHQRLSQNAPDTPYLVLYDLTHAEVGLTTYMRKKAAEIHDLRPDVKGRIALVLRPTPTNALFRFFIATRQGVSRPARIFFDTNAALAWLREGL
jgi:hypothetical protein